MSDVEDVFMGEEAELPKKVTVDMRPSKEEVELHDKTRLPERSWRPRCVRGKARRRGHRKRRKARGGAALLPCAWLCTNSLQSIQCECIPTATFTT